MSVTLMFVTQEKYFSLFLLNINSSFRVRQIVTIVLH